MTTVVYAEYRYDGELNHKGMEEKERMRRRALEVSNRKNNRNHIYICMMLVLVVLIKPFILQFNAKIDDKNCVSFKGSGTSTEPYLIESYSDLKTFRDLVNQGNPFTDAYFLQTNDIDIEDSLWIPIGLDEELTCFEGSYDGSGFCINNLNISDEDAYVYTGLFGVLKGRVANLCIESGTIKGVYTGAIAGELYGYDAVIFNCYNKARVEGIYAAGIVEQVSSGNVISCINVGNVSGESAYGVVGNAYDAKIYACHALDMRVAPEGVTVQGSHKIDETKLNSGKFALELTIYASIAKQIFGTLTDKLTVQQWDVSEGTLGYSDNRLIQYVVQFIDSYLLVVVVLAVCFYMQISIMKHSALYFLDNHKQLYNFLLILSFLSCYFYDTFSYKLLTSYWNLGKGLLLVSVNYLLLLCLYIGLTTNYICNGIRCGIKKYYKLICIMIPIVILELLQYSNTQRFDGNIYYGSLVRALELYDLGLLSYVGAFNCWKLIHGLAFLITPLEVMNLGYSIGVYISNTMITIVTITLLYKLLKKFYVNISDVVTFLTIILFIFSPYILGLFSYFSIEWHLPFLAVWLLYAIQEDNDYLICFSGFLLCFTKITGAVFYVFVLLAVGAYDMYKSEGSNIGKKIVSWFRLKRVILWIIPAVIFLLAYLYDGYYTAQYFLGAYQPDSVLVLWNWNQIANSTLQAFVFGFRWLSVFAILVAFLNHFITKKKKDILTEDGKKIVIGLFSSGIGVFCMLCLYNADASCPRYTTIYSLLYAVIIPWAMITLFDKGVLVNTACGVVAVLNVIQTYWTIDPVIINYCKSISTGEKQIYRLAYNGDERLGMNLGTEWGGDYAIICDIYSYNNEYSFYENLIDEFYKDMVDEYITVYELDISTYEINLSGRGNSTYNIYWDLEKQKRTFVWNDNAVYLTPQNIYTYYLDDELFVNSLPDEFIVLAPGRVETQECEKKIEEKRYVCVEKKQYSNIYGSMTAVRYVKNDGF